MSRIYIHKEMRHIYNVKKTSKKKHLGILVLCIIIITNEKVVNMYGITIFILSITCFIFPFS